VVVPESGRFKNTPVQSSFVVEYHFLVFSEAVPAVVNPRNLICILFYTLVALGG
jgi:hypothetical protein